MREPCVKPVSPAAGIGIDGFNLLVYLIPVHACRVLRYTSSVFVIAVAEIVVDLPSAASKSRVQCIKRDMRLATTSQERTDMAADFFYYPG